MSDYLTDGYFWDSYDDDEDEIHTNMWDDEFEGYDDDVIDWDEDDWS